MTTPAEAYPAGERTCHLPPAESLVGDRVCVKPAPVTDPMSREIERVLHSSSHCGLRGVRCHFANGRATLRGEVASYYLKQIAQTIVGRLAHVSSVDNQLHVGRLRDCRFDG